jgi:hypothetical protein
MENIKEPIVCKENKNAKLNEDPLFKKISEQLSFQDKEVFLQSFYSYLTNNSEEDFIVDLDHIWEWLGYTRKQRAKDLLVKHFVTDIDYRVFTQPGNNSNGGRPVEKFLMTVKTFKKLCLKSDTKKADKIHDYYLKMETIMFQHTKELLQQKDLELQQLQNKQHILPFEPTPYQELPREQIIYVFQQVGDSNPNLYKIGETVDWKKRQRQYKTGSSQGIQVVFQYKTHNSKLLETVVKAMLFRYKFGNEKITKGGSEFYECNLQHIINIINITGACIDTLFCFRASIDKPDILRYIYKNTLVSIFENDTNLIKSFLNDDELQLTFQSSYEDVLAHTKRTLKRALKQPHRFKTAYSSINDNIHQDINMCLDKALNNIDLNLE